MKIPGDLNTDGYSGRTGVEENLTLDFNTIMCSVPAIMTSNTVFSPIT